MSGPKLSGRVVLAFACVYFFWGSTFVAIRYGVAVMSPWMLASTRYLIAGPLMLGLCALRGLPLWQSRRDFALLALIGVLMLGMGNMGLVWAEQYLPSGLASLLIASVPIFVALLEAWLPGGEGLRLRGWAGIVLGFAGLLVLLVPGLRAGGEGHHGVLAGSLVAIASAFAWSCGSIVSRRTRLGTGPFVAAAWEMVFGGLFNSMLLMINGGPSHVHWGMHAVSAIAWLVVFGSLVGYTAYIYLLEHVPVAKVSTYAYINPIVAVVLGALLLGERLGTLEYVAMVAILGAVFLVNSSRLKGQAAEVVVVDSLQTERAARNQ